jgi:cytochrome c biogenesis protein CcmG, thiol:disulfide interchange protein DsbE
VAICFSVKYWIAALLTAGVLAGCGATQPKDSAPARRVVSAAFKGAPGPLASLHDQANKLLAGGTAAYNQRIASLKGFPIVVNKWASWCQPCQTEFPVFQRASVAFGKRVGFMGIDGKDQNQPASAFLSKFPVTYPSYVDPKEDIARSIHAETYFPQTIYYDRNGKIVFDHAGPYESAAALEKDIRRYALK